MYLSALTLFVLGVQPALAYTDPGSGAMLWQMLAGLFAGSLFTLRRLVAQLGRGGSRRGSIRESE